MSDSHMSTTGRQPAISIIMAVHNQASELERNLPMLLALPYEPGYEVIVVDESSTDGTDDVLANLKTQYPNLYTTYIPDSSHYISRRKLALTVGVKASHYEWIIITEADSHPASDTWLQAMAEGMTDDVDTVCGYTSYEPGTKSSYAYQRLLTWRRQIATHPYRYDGANLAIRKQTFMARNGFLKNLQYLRGELDFLVNETESDRIVMADSLESKMLQEQPTTKAWDNSQLYYMDIRDHLSRTFLPRLLFVLSQAYVHLGYLLLIAAIIISVMLHNVMMLATASGLLLLHFVLRLFFCYRRCKAYNEHIAIWKLPFLDLQVAWHYAHYWLKYRLSNKNDYTRK